jgi:chorismate dehydratase
MSRPDKGVGLEAPAEPAPAKLALTGAESLGQPPNEPPVRVGRIEFVNCYPLYDHFADELVGHGVRATVVEGYPTALNRLLVEGEIDVTLPSSIEFARHADLLRLVPQVSISSLGAVDSVQLFSRLPRADVRTIALTEKSATSVCLLRVLCREWGIEPQFVPRRGSFAEVLRDNDAVLLIGDEALHVLRSGFCPYNYDLGEEWRRATGLPMVFAVCAARGDFVAARPQAAAAVGAALLASRDRCAARPEQTAASAALIYDFSQAYLMEYFDKLKFGFTPEYRAGLQEFYRRAAAIGELDAVPDVVHAGAGEAGA